MSNTADFKDTDDDTPELINPALLPPNYAQKIETDILDPVVSSDSFTRWTLPRKGFLSHQSKITMSIQGQANNEGVWFPVNIGVNSLISRCVLKAGNRTICETSDWNFLQGYRSMFLTPENNRERETFLTQRSMSRRAQYANDEAFDTSAPTYTLDNGEFIDAVADDQEMPMFSAMSSEARKPSPVYSVFLGDLFDIFNGNNLPLYMINDDVHVEIYWAPTKNKRVWIDGDDGANDHNFLLDQNDVKMVYDTIYYDGETMEKYRNGKGKEITMSYVDYRLTKRTGEANGFENIIQDIGGAGRLVDKVIVGFADTQLTGLHGGEDVITGPYWSQANAVADTSLEVNIRYNDRDEYTRNLDNLATIFNESKVAENGNPPYVSQGEYSSLESTTAITTTTLQGQVMRTSLEGAFCWLGFKIKRGERINNQGMTLVYKTAIAGVDTHQLKIWIALKKVARIENGLLTCYFA